MSRPRSTQDLLPSETAFLATMEELGFGRFEQLQIRGGELVLNPWPVTVLDIKFAAKAAADSAAPGNAKLRPQVAEFFEYVRDVATGEIRELQVRHGLPFSMEIAMAGARSRTPEGDRRG